MNDFTKNITVVNRSWRGVSETYFVYKNLSNYLEEIAENRIVTLNKDGTYGYETAWESFELSNYEHKLNHELKLSKEVLEEFSQRYGIYYCREFLKSIDCDCIIADYHKTPKS